MTGLTIRQSDLASFQRCAQQVKLNKAAQVNGWRPDILSATARGTVWHYAFMVLQKLHHEGREDALPVAIATFEQYWDPSNISQISEGPVDVWLPRDSWGGLRKRSIEALRGAYEFLNRDKSILLAVEHSFNVPIEIDGETHTLHGTVDRLVLRMIERTPVLGIDDAKTGQIKSHLDSATQWTVYAFASQDPCFWGDFDSEGFEEVERRLGARGVQLYRSHEDLPLIARRGRWLAARDEFAVKDCGWRTEAHYARLRAQLREYVAAVRADVYPLTVDGAICQYCPWNSGVCGNAPIPLRQEGIE